MTARKITLPTLLRIITTTSSVSLAFSGTGNVTLNWNEKETLLFYKGNDNGTKLKI